MDAGEYVKLVGFAKSEAAVGAEAEEGVGDAAYKDKVGAARGEAGVGGALTVEGGVDAGGDTDRAAAVGE